MQIMTQDKPKRKPGRPRKDNEPLNKNVIAKYVNRGVTSPTTIAEATGTTVRAAVDALKRYGFDKDSVEEYRKNKAEILDGIQAKLLQAAATKDLEGVPVQQLITSAAILYDKSRLETGQSTGNIAVIIKAADRLECLDDTTVVIK